ncbi:glycosyltransferase [Altererythrobacter sp. ZODW24]|uniref:glycosyltransferase n=1 Tax=Altererythrobacter sp. ZODW24 TaxID=2185142 RepID=UPI000DF8290D|nr:glycosyltransferase [Altererythrobacter sp. ZODW24]
MVSILHISHSDEAGGAAIAARRMVEAQRAQGLDARMLVIERKGQRDFVEQAGNPGRVRLARMAAKRIARLGARKDKDGMRSLGFIASGLGAAIRDRSPDVVHWHWVGVESVSLAEMASTGIPCAWTCHDQWAFCGAEHYAPDRRFETGYAGAGSFDIDAMTFRRKHAAWTGWRPTLIAPSEWMAKEAHSSALFGDAPIVTIPNTVSTAIFVPSDKQEARVGLGLPADRKIVLFGADSGTVDPRKGFDLLMAALKTMPEPSREQIALATFGGSVRASGKMAGFDHIELGRFNSDEDVAQLYSAADVFVAPSRQDNLPNTMVEAQTCGLRSVAFDIGGMGDIIASPELGELVQPFDVGAFGAAILSAATTEYDRGAVHRRAAERFGAETVVRQCTAVYDRLIAERSAAS